ncbi:hypothetical protein Trydic_g15758, partial [Trypoxylus dichotomus]
MHSRLEDWLEQLDDGEVESFEFSDLRPKLHARRRAKRNDAQDQPGVRSHDGSDSAALSGMKTATRLITENKPLTYDVLTDSPKPGPSKTEKVTSSSEIDLSAIPKSITLTDKTEDVSDDSKAGTTKKTDLERTISIKHYIDIPPLDLSPRSDDLERSDSDT